MISTSVLPAPLMEISARALELLRQRAPELLAGLSSEQFSHLQQVFGLSDYVAAQICRQPQWLEWLLQPRQAEESTYYYARLQQQLNACSNEEMAKKVLRDFRNQHLATLAYRDLLNLAPLSQSLNDISALAEALIIAARDWLYQFLSQQYGYPMDRQGNQQPLLILGMGKLGGRELNFSSDIDLIFVFPEHGETQGGRRSLDNQQFFTRMGQKLVQLLDQVTVDGFVFRVDMRLRPYGESGPLVLSLAAFEDYYQEQGRDWERFAMVKARVLTASGITSSESFTDDEQELQQLLRPFIYRRYIDFSAIEALRKMKQLIQREVRRRQLTNNIKLGAGGIREVEFIVQSFQLIRGGREPSLRVQSIYQALAQLVSLGQIDQATAQQLTEGYNLLRRVENLLQAFADQQTQTLPILQEPAFQESIFQEPSHDWLRLCWVLGQPNAQALFTTIEQTMATIHQIFIQTIGGESEEEETEHWAVELWQAETPADMETCLIEHFDGLSMSGGVNGGVSGFVNELPASLDFIAQFHQWGQITARKPIGPRGRETLDKLMPLLLEGLSLQTAPFSAWQPVAKVLDQILTRTTYLELLFENPGARAQLISLCQASPWIAEQLARFPMLLDELIDPVHLYDTTALEDYPDELRQALLRVPEDDLEMQMEALRQFKLTQQLKIAAADVTGILPIMQISDHLTYLAQAIIEQVVQQAWQQISARYGTPTHLRDEEQGFAVIGYGKLGGIELGYGSDLDLVFLHNAPAHSQTNTAQHKGARQIESSHFYVKLAQRILHLFSTRTMSGALYEVDMRLRPSGSSGLLVSHLETFADYQSQEAWTWEHQALVRARFVYGQASLATRFAQIRAQVLAQSRVTTELATQVHEMRLKMRHHLLQVTAEQFDLKQSAGGIADIEFLAQFLVLAHSHEHSELTRWSDNVRIFEILASCGLMTEAQADCLTQAYCHWRNLGHRLTLQGEKAVIANKEAQALAQPVLEIYQQFLAIRND